MTLEEFREKANYFHAYIIACSGGNIESATVDSDTFISEQSMQDS